MHRLFVLLLLFILNSLHAAANDEEPQERVRFRFRYPREQVKLKGTPPAKDAGDHGHKSMSEAEFAKRRGAVKKLIQERRSAGGELTKADVVKLYAEAGDFKVLHSLLGDAVSASESRQIGRLRQEIHEEVLRNLAESGEFGKRMGVNDFGSGADMSKVDAKTDIDFTAYAQNQKITGQQLVARYIAEFRKVTARYGVAVDPGAMDIVAHRYEATIPDWRQNVALADFEVRMRTGLDLLAKNPEAYFLEGAYLQQVMKRSADPASKTFAWYETGPDGKLKKRMVNATQVAQFFYKPDIDVRYAWGAAVGNWHFFHAHRDDLAAQGKYILRSIDDGAGLLLGSSKAGNYEDLSPSERKRVVRQLYGSSFDADTFARIEAVIETAAHMRKLKADKRLSLGTDSGRMEAFAPLMDLERQKAGGVRMSDTDLLRMAMQSFQTAGNRLLLQNNILTSSPRLGDWLAPPLRPGQRMDVIDENGQRRVFDVDAAMVKRLQYSAFFELKAGLGLMSDVQIRKLKQANPRFARDIDILDGVIKKQKQLLDAPVGMKPAEATEFRTRAAAELQADVQRVRQTIAQKGYRAGAWEATRTAWARGDQVEAWMHKQAVNRLTKLAGGARYVPVLERLRGEVAGANEQLLGPKWMMRLDRGTSIVEILKAYVREGELNENVMKVALYEGFSYLPGVGTLYSVQGGLAGVTTMTLVRLIPGYGQILLVGQFAKGSVELVGMAIFEPLKRDKVTLAYQGYLEPQAGGLITTGQKERVESPRPAVLHFVDPQRSLPIEERREAMYRYLHERVEKRMSADPEIWFTEDELPRDWQAAEFRHLNDEVDAYIEHWWNGTGPFAEFDVLTVHRGADVRNELKMQLKQDYITGMQRSIQKRIQEQENLQRQMLGLLTDVAATDGAMDAELANLQGDIKDAGLLSYAHALAEMPKSEPFIEILMAPEAREIEREDQALEETTSIQLRAKISASMEDYPAPWRIEWKISATGADAVDFTGLGGDNWEAERGPVTVTAIAYDAENHKITESSVTLEVEKDSETIEQEDEDESASEQAASPEDDAAVLGPMNTAVAEAAAGSVRAGALCTEGINAAKTAKEQLAEISARTAQLQSSKQQFTQAAQSLLESEAELRKFGARIEKLAETIAQARDKAGRAALSACEALETLTESFDQWERQRLAQSSADHAARAADYLKEAEEAGRELQQIKARLQEHKLQASAARAARSELEQALSQLDPLLGQAEESIAVASSAASEIDVLMQELNSTRDRARARMQNAGPMTEEGVAEAETSLGQVEALVSSVEECPAELDQGILEQQTALSQTLQGIDELSMSAEQLWSELEQRGILLLIDETAEDADASFAVVDMFLSSIRDYVRDAKRCAELAERKASEPITVRVPNLTHMSLSDAERLLSELRLVGLREAGSPAPSEALEHHVEAQSPAAGTRAEPQDRVTLTLYSKVSSLISVPSLEGLPLSRAREQLQALGLEAALAAGSPALREDLEHHVQAQSPSAGFAVDKGSTVTLVLYGEYQEPIVIPDLRGSRRDEAIARLSSLGFEVAVRVSGEPPNRESADVVYQQAPIGPAEQLSRSVSITVYDEWVEQEEEQVSETGPSEEEEGPPPLFVISKIYFPKLPDDLPEGVKLADVLAGMTISNVQLEPNEGSALMTISDDALGLYPREFFKVGQRYACDFNVSAQGQSFGGALLLVISEIIEDPAVFEQRFLSNGPQVKGAMHFHFKDATGTFNQAVAEDGQSYTLSGGPIERGWSSRMRQKNLDLYKQVALMFDCFIATAVYKNPYAAQLAALRRFRDRVLLQSKAGAHLVQQYYRVGPLVAREVARRPRVRAVLLPAINALAKIADEIEPDSKVLQSAVQWVDEQIGDWLETRDVQMQLDPQSLSELIHAQEQP